MFWRIDWAAASETARAHALGVEEPTSARALQGRRRSARQTQTKKRRGIAGMTAIPQLDVDEEVDKTDPKGSSSSSGDDSKALALRVMNFADEAINEQATASISRTTEKRRSNSEPDDDDWHDTQSSLHDKGRDVIVDVL